LPYSSFSRSRRPGQLGANGTNPWSARPSINVDRGRVPLSRACRVRFALCLLCPR
jgi:hypothetical protein